MLRQSQDVKAQILCMNIDQVPEIDPGDRNSNILNLGHGQTRNKPVHTEQENNG